MSRFPELFEEAIDAVVGAEALHVETLAEHIARHIVDRQSALRAEARITAKMAGAAPNAGERAPDPGDGLAGRHRRCHGVGRPARRRRRGTRHQRVPVRPGPRPRTRRRAARRGGLRGRRADPRARPARDPQPARPRHAARRDGAAARRERPRRDRRGLDERTGLRAAQAARRAVRRRARAPAAALRRGLRSALAEGRAGHALGARATSDFLFARQVNFETIHTHDVLAEREGTVAELRGELESGIPAPRHTSLAEWLRPA